MFPNICFEIPWIYGYLVPFLFLYGKNFDQFCNYTIKSLISILYSDIFTSAELYQIKFIVMSKSGLYKIVKLLLFFIFFTF